MSVAVCILLSKQVIGRASEGVAWVAVGFHVLGRGKLVWGSGWCVPQLHNSMEKLQNIELGDIS